MLFWIDWFVIWFEKIVRNDFSRPTGARRVAYREVGDNPSRRAIHKKTPSVFWGGFFMYAVLDCLVRHLVRKNRQERFFTTNGSQQGRLQGSRR